MEVARRLEAVLEPSVFDLKVAVATQSREFVDQHFGQTEALLIYGISDSECQLIRATEFPVPKAERSHGALPAKIAELSDCNAVICNAIGNAVVLKLMDKQIMPIVVFEQKPIRSVLEELQTQLREDRPLWMTRILAKREKPPSLERLLDEPWN
ncbi:NifB/NifX family molybdenum-iron cluster-binding protein [Photobacterium sp. ZSDE20]|uniref:NifB/NifX family molybdenum-iron cluster-binding protein n=1 Tax=Photobacterium pectinilyticum TaxID=2906793 RepID=A0ABT1N4C2_9GAMM|nr:NifB/NifX family molybdenum-iron cluster-binding protein [Photobacterium sp. ZSDE20]MCQ1058571.1 NifB/NifX family molybdenum-iron cluster-binding protein [Photobacterium sp. ZSDE20]MDD1826308.1 NifB/NifX family molybdenum-iron cluster-binding protein [Photobacterium sp. ZSDE20]